MIDALRIGNLINLVPQPNLRAQFCLVPLHLPVLVPGGPVLAAVLVREAFDVGV